MSLEDEEFAQFSNTTSNFKKKLGLSRAKSAIEYTIFLFQLADYYNLPTLEKKYLQTSLTTLNSNLKEINEMNTEQTEENLEEI